jgi:transcriptional regulator with XRE-family HTH domain
MRQARDTSAAGTLFGTRLRELRQKRGLSQQALAARVGIPQTHISAMETGIQLPNLMTILRLAHALECKVTKLMSEFDETNLSVLV